VGLALCATPSAQTSAQEALPSGVLCHPQDQCLALLAERVPGFAGFWFEGNTLVLAMVDTAHVTAALREVKDYIAPRVYRAVRVQPAQFDFAQLYGWKQLAFNNLDTIRWTVLGLGHRGSPIMVAVGDSSRLALARETLLALGIPSAAFELEVDSVIFGEPTPLKPPPGR
jgi:hypothetical protein